ncbi:MAG: YmdB family metallophosphoesterase, partial [Limisphaerales bacterium]
MGSIRVCFSSAWTGFSNGEIGKQRRSLVTVYCFQHTVYSAPVNVLFIGDIVGEPGRCAVKELVPKLRREHELDIVIANGENSAGGSGITPNTAR